MYFLQHQASHTQEPSSSHTTLPPQNLPSPVQGLAHLRERRGRCVGCWTRQHHNHSLPVCGAIWPETLRTLWMPPFDVISPVLPEHLSFLHPLHATPLNPLCITAIKLIVVTVRLGKHDMSSPRVAVVNELRRDGRRRNIGINPLAFVLLGDVIRTCLIFLPHNNFKL